MGNFQYSHHHNQPTNGKRNPYQSQSHNYQCQTLLCMHTKSWRIFVNGDDTVNSPLRPPPPASRWELGRGRADTHDALTEHFLFSFPPPHHFLPRRASEQQYTEGKSGKREPPLLLKAKKKNMLFPSLHLSILFRRNTPLFPGRSRVKTDQQVLPRR